MEARVQWRCSRSRVSFAHLQKKTAFRCSLEPNQSRELTDNQEAREISLTFQSFIATHDSKVVDIGSCKITSPRISAVRWREVMLRRHFVVKNHCFRTPRKVSSKTHSPHFDPYKLCKNNVNLSSFYYNALVRRTCRGVATIP